MKCKVMVERVQRKRIKGWCKPENTIYVGRGTKWGNPFKVGVYLSAWGKGFIAIKMTDKPEEIHKIYRSGIFDHKITLGESMIYYDMYLKFMIQENKLNPKELRGANLMCWCSLLQTCHADALLKLANE